MKINNYISKLIDSGFSQARKKPNHFFKELMPYTALAINLAEQNGCIRVVFGCGSTAFTKFPRCENELIDNGFFDNADINVRRELILSDSESESFAEKEIKEFFSQFYGMEKDALLSSSKERRKAFINSISEKLKPLGFKKKGNTWKYPFSDSRSLEFLLYSRFSDEYRCELYIFKEKIFPPCYYEIIPFNEKILFIDWQLIDKKLLDHFIDNQIVKRLNEIINIGLEEFSKDPIARKNSFCHHDKCEHCWMKQTL